ncbi:MAG: MarR family transcriptional regulator [SAR324 cluster bacterium]|nr:MarR family transcriptional regulator [SAR324 cluster bacterium]
MNQDNALFAYSQPEASPGFLLWQVSNLWQKAIRNALSESKLTHSQFVVAAGLLWLQKNRKEISQSELSTFTKVDKMVTSTVIRQLETKKLVERIKNQRDQRAYYLRLTVVGEAIILKALPRVEAVDQEFFGKLGEGEVRFTHQLQVLL